MVAFERDLGAERSIARLRLAGALIVGASSIALAAGGGGSIRWIWVVLGLLASLGWLASYARTRRVQPGDRLELGPDSLFMRYRQKDTRVEWSRMKAVIADEDRLHIRVELQDEEVVIPLVWRAIGLHELAEEIDAARLSANDAASAESGVH